MRKSFKVGMVLAFAVVVVGATAAWGWGPRQGQSADSPGGLITTAAEAVDMTVAELRAEMHGGKTLSEILAENGADAEAVVSETLAWMETRLLQAVEDGRITEELAAERLESAESRLIERLEQTAPLGPMWGSDQGRGHGGRAFGGSAGGFGKGMGRGHGYGHGPGQGTCIVPAAPAITS